MRRREEKNYLFRSQISARYAFLIGRSFITMAFGYASLTIKVKNRRKTLSLSTISCVPFLRFVLKTKSRRVHNMIAASLRKKERKTERYLRNWPFRSQENTHFRLIVIGRASPRAISGRANHSGPLWRRAVGGKGWQYSLSKTWYSGPLAEKVVGWAWFGRHLRRRHITYRGASNGGHRYNEPSSAAARKSWTMPGSRVHAIRYRRFLAHATKKGQKKSAGNE